MFSSEGFLNKLLLGHVVSRLTQPAFETRFAESGIIVRNKCSFAQLPSEEARVLVRDNLTRII